MTDLVFATNTANAQNMLKHLVASDEQFSPPLSSRVNLSEYCEKLALNATRFEAWSDKTLIGLVAAYCTHPERGFAHISSVSVLSAYTGQGIARRLMNTCRDYAASAGFERLTLEVDPQAFAALELYKKMGFKVDDPPDRAAIKMTLAL